MSVYGGKNQMFCSVLESLVFLLVPCSNSSASPHNYKKEMKEVKKWRSERKKGRRERERERERGEGGGGRREGGRGGE